ncbi:MAG: carboxypeptidase regulatory-like domain-containing protein [Verrucomicrobia bacterium]|nr:carboxypeptidase regulatory-like domain-containing protein [Verrucomicrobiota bacterium]
MTTNTLLASLSAVLALFGTPAARAAEGAGTIAGRVSNLSTGVYLEKARITVEGTALETFTDAAGYYRLAQVPAGTAKVKAFFTGLVAHAGEITVPAGGTAQHDIGLEVYRGRAGAAAGATVKLDQYVVTASKEMDGAAIAINEQRFAPNIVTVVAADEFGSMAEGNVAEFMKFLPGVTMDVGESGDANSVSINGVPAANVPITVGGFDLASANQFFGTGTGREVNLDQVSLNSIARIEVAYTPTPEVTGSALAGSVNMVPRSAFERSRPVFTTSAFLMMRDSEKTLRKTPGPGRTPTRKIHPGFDFSYIVPVNKRFGFTVSGGRSTNFTTEDIVVRDWRAAALPTTGLVAGTAAQYPDTTPDRPYLSRFSFDLDTKVTTRTSIGTTVDFKLTPSDIVSFSFQYANNTSMTNGRRLNFQIVRVEPGDFTPTSTRGTGSVTVQGGDYTFNGTTYMPGLTYRHNGPVWKAEAGTGLSHATSHIRDVSKGFFNSTIATLNNVKISFEEINYLRPATISVVDTTTGVPVSPYDLSNFSLSTANTQELDGLDTKRSAYANVRRDFYGRLPVSLKAGLDVRQSVRDFRRENRSYSHVGADGRANTADDNAKVILDESISQRIPPFGFPRTQWIDDVEYYDLYRANPSHFTTNDVTAHNNRTANSKYAEEVISSAYLRGDLQFFERRLKLVGGIRAEQTNVKAEGRLLDPTLNYQRDARSQVVSGPTGTPLLIAPAGTLAAAQLTTIDRGLHAEKEYLRWFPSLNASFNLRDNLIARAGHYWSVGRPNFSQYAGALSLPDTERLPSTGNRISVANAGIKAWSAKTTKVTLEYYFERVGLISVGAFRRDFENFFGSTVFQATPEFLSLYSLDPEVYGAYDVATQYNLPSRVRMSGVEFNYKQALTFLPNWARGVQVFANASAQRATGEQASNFDGYVPRTYSWGVSLSREKYKLRANWNYRGRDRNSVVTGRGIEPGTFNWDSKRLYLDLSGEYSLTRNLALFTNLRNVGGRGTDVSRAGPSTPPHAELRVREDWGSLWTFGMKGTF